MLFTLVSGMNNVNLFAHKHSLTSVPRNQPQDKSFQEKTKKQLWFYNWYENNDAKYTKSILRCQNLELVNTKLMVFHQVGLYIRVLLAKIFLFLYWIMLFKV